ncbi:MAG: CvpA family protein [Clostridia bacterium]
MPKNVIFIITIMLDVIAVASVIYFTMRGKRRGLIRTVAGLAVLIISFWGAGFLADSTAPTLSRTFVEPRMENWLSPKIISANATTPAQFANTLISIGIPKELAKSVSNSAPISDLILNASKTISEKITWGVLGLLYFLLILVLMRLVVRMLDQLFNLPVLSFVNALGGAICGAALGYFLIMIIATILINLNLGLTKELASGTKVLNFILTSNPF